MHVTRFIQAYQVHVQRVTTHSRSVFYVTRSLPSDTNVQHVITSVPFDFTCTKCRKSTKKRPARSPPAIQAYQATRTYTTCPPIIQVTRRCTTCHTSIPSEPHVHHLTTSSRIVLHATRTSPSDPNAQPLTVISSSDTHVQHVTASTPRDCTCTTCHKSIPRDPHVHNVPPSTQVTHAYTTFYAIIPSKQHVHHVTTSSPCHCTCITCPTSTRSELYVHHVSYKHIKRPTRVPRVV